ncbi:MAG TPA: sugar ABC transporter ATP-binding protein, partial [Planctomycetia bacterium]|nr:sugar ABC transporter ATP-binding protein [Planctomycetia bacterium]
MEGAVPLLRLAGVEKRFGGTRALAGVDLEVRGGEIHALVGENGAGKSTLIRILAGIHRPDAGSILWREQPVEIKSVRDSAALGIATIHQELSLAPALSVAENLYLGAEPATWGFVRRGQMRRDAKALVHELGFDEIAEVDRPVGELSVGRRQLVEIARALATDAKLLILDEPTASLSESESAALFTRLLELRKRGTAIIYISHRLDELARIADRATVLRDGRSVGELAATSRPGGGRDFQRDELVRLMVGREVGDHYPRAAHRPGDIALEVKNLRSPDVHDVSFELRYGEVLGLVGLVGAGRTEILRVLFGVDRADSGEILIDGKPARIRRPADALVAGMALVPEDRKKEGLFLGESVGFNLALPWV